MIRRIERFGKKITAQFAQRFADVAVGIGLTKNSFGLGGDYFFNADKSKGTAGVWDFSNDERNCRSPYVKVGMEHFIFKNLFLSRSG